jgi:hypothetical protein
LASAPLIAAIVIVFFTGDSWKILGQGFDWQFFALMAFFLIFSLLGVADLRNLKSHFSVSPEDLGTKMSDPSVLSLSRALTDLGYELPRAPKISRLAMINTTAVYLGIITANLLLIGFLVSSGLVLIGLIRIDAGLTLQLSGVPAHVILRLPGKMVIKQELLSLSLTLGGLAILSFVFVTLPNQKGRSDFVSTASSGLRNVLLAFAVYQAALKNEATLTGVSSQPLDAP